jgi:hypothetical protein
MNSMRQEKMEHWRNGTGSGWVKSSMVRCDGRTVIRSRIGFFLWVMYGSISDLKWNRVRWVGIRLRCAEVRNDLKR